MNFVLDLDLTIWDTFDRHGNPIWAKQLIAPYRNESDVVIDDVGSRCLLRKGVKAFCNDVRKNQHELSFLSAGALHGVEEKNQPSIKLLNIFSLWECFNGVKILSYKTLNKAEALGQLGGKIIFFDDNPAIIESVRFLNHVNVVDSSNLNDWTNCFEDYQNG